MTKAMANMVNYKLLWLSSVVLYLYRLAQLDFTSTITATTDNSNSSKNNGRYYCSSSNASSNSVPATNSSNNNNDNYLL